MSSIFDSVVLGLTWLGVLAVAGTIGVVGLVVADGWRSRPRARVAPLRPQLRRAA